MNEDIFTTVKSPATQRALEMGSQILRRMAKREDVLLLASATPFYESRYAGEPPMRWSGASIDYGDAALALAFDYLDRVQPDSGWDLVAHNYLSEAVSCLAKRKEASTGLFHIDSSVGVAYVTRLLSRNGTRYAEAVRALDGEVLRIGRAVMDSIEDYGSLHWSTYDHISGLAGIGRYLLLAAQDNPDAEYMLRSVIQRLIKRALSRIPDFSTPIKSKENPFAFPINDLKNSDAYIGLGLAHGISGPLALMALALRSGLDITNLREATYSLGNWICQRIEESDYGADIPYGVTGELKKLPMEGVTRTAWCHGNPGVSRTLQITGQILKDTYILERSQHLMTSALTRPRAIQGILSPTFCHGLAGLVYIGWKHTQISQDIASGISVEILLDELLNNSSIENPLLYQEVHPEIGAYTNPGFLNGSIGIALTLLSIGSQIEAAWDQTVLLD